MYILQHLVQQGACAMKAGSEAIHPYSPCLHLLLFTFYIGQLRPNPNQAITCCVLFQSCFFEHSTVPPCKVWALSECSQELMAARRDSRVVGKHCLGAPLLRPVLAAFCCRMPPVHAGCRRSTSLLRPVLDAFCRQSIWDAASRLAANPTAVMPSATPLLRPVLAAFCEI